jgi:hypothetical protein
MTSSSGQPFSTPVPSHSQSCDIEDTDLGTSAATTSPKHGRYYPNNPDEDQDAENPEVQAEIAWKKKLILSLGSLYIPFSDT